jgi:hypothetical protein
VSLTSTKLSRKKIKIKVPKTNVFMPLQAIGGSLETISKPWLNQRDILSLEWEIQLTNKKVDV